MNKKLSTLYALLFIFPVALLASEVVSNTEPESAMIKVHDQIKPKAILSPINSAFGIPLGAHFQDSMVANVISKQASNYKGKDGIKLQGSLLLVEPHETDPNFQKYSVKTSDTGIIFAIQGDYQYDDNQEQVANDEVKPQGRGKGVSRPGNKLNSKAIENICKVKVNEIAKGLQVQYGQPRGTGRDGIWFTFQEVSESANKTVNLYGHRCRTGMYSIIYSDNLVRRETLPVAEGASAVATSE